MNISLIAAISNNLVIGYNNKIPWYIPEDLKWFKEKTINKNIIMGRITWESIRNPLPMRKNIVISSNEIKTEGIIWANSISNAIISAQCNQEIMVIGGSKIYKKMLFYANKLYLTHIDINIIGDAYFPEYRLYPYWKVLFRKKITKNSKNPYNYSFEILSR
ncbi:MAG: type 3 dihydrofolate reductase [Buchnera aphidicola (Microlophium carnosum)]|uniref:Dihydrofolate reductase n=1 Tax=Buchnera aphidicola (Microlophium carnosum) TaxID=2708354 RepID=A0A6G9JSR4_9GAMM|nr:MAG: type 3 dihydrofolate reductase [Buchnera aphidicola (Microlophium carnosum)]